MTDNISPKVKEGWSGPGRRDGTISPFMPGDDAYHLEEKGYEWWYFDAHLDSGHTIVAFFHASNPNPGVAGKSGVELTILRPDGSKTTKFYPYKKEHCSFSRDTPDVTIGQNTMKSDWTTSDLPVYEIFIQEEGITFELTYKSLVKGWKPGDGYSYFEGMGFFAWVVPFPRADVVGRIRDGDKTIDVKGIGYHDHNWLNFQFQRYINYWMWGRVYSDTYTVSYALIQLNDKLDNHTIKVLSLAENENLILSTGDYAFIKSDMEYNEIAKHQYPKKVVIDVPGELNVELNVKRIFEAENMLNNFNPILRVLAKYVMGLRPGYLRLNSDFRIEVIEDGQSKVETGSTLHEFVAFKPYE